MRLQGPVSAFLIFLVSAGAMSAFTVRALVQVRHDG